LRADRNADTFCSGAILSSNMEYQLSIMALSKLIV